jgi:adenine-specific DNA-methyltransferase
MPRGKKNIVKIAAEKAGVAAYEHKEDKRTNIPTQELSHHAKEPKTPPKKKYAYDPSLDPQIIWSGKSIDADLLASLKSGVAEKEEFLVDTVPLYIQEKISPEAIINRLKSDTDDGPNLNLSLFGDSADRVFEEKVDFYKHENNWANRMILGDSLEVMNSLLEKEGMRGKVQCVYIDPPYGVKFGSNWQVSTRKRDVKDGRDDEYTRQPEQVKAFRDTWELGIHSYLSYLRDRLIAARELLTESGSCFVQISDDNVHLVRNIMDEVFSSGSFVTEIFVKKTTGAGAPAELLAPPSVGDYVVWYAKNNNEKKFRKVFVERGFGGEGATGYKKIELPDGSRMSVSEWEKLNDKKFSYDELPKGAKIYALDNLTSQSGGDSARFPIKLGDKTFTIQRGSWKTNQSGIARLIQLKRLDSTDNNIGYVRYFEDFPFMPMTNLWTDTVGQNQFGGDKVYVVQTALSVVQRCLLMTTDPGDLVLDPTCGSGTTAYVAEQWGRRWITTDTSRVALALARTRLMTAKFPYYAMRNKANIKEGFEYKTVPHITLKSLAQNEPADQEVLYDQPREEKSIVRVSGPLTIESLSPHRISAGDELLSSEDYAHTVIENLRRAGVSTGVKDGGIHFENLDVVADSEGMLQAAGESKNNDGKILRIAVAIGPEYGSVDDDMIRDAVKQAAKYYDMLVVAAPAFEGSAFTEDTNPFKLRVVKVKINPDLSMGDLLKKTGSGNLFMAIGEPDIAIHDEKDEKISVEVRGVDVYDAVHGDIRSSSVDDIACWFIDTNYNEEAFFVTHAYFTGADKPYEKLKKALKAEIDEEVWESLYSARSRPFMKPKTGKIAIKVINHFGDEVMKIIEINK